MGVFRPPMHHYRFFRSLDFHVPVLFSGKLVIFEGADDTTSTRMISNDRERDPSQVRVVERLETKFKRMVIVNRVLGEKYFHIPWKWSPRSFGGKIKFIIISFYTRINVLWSIQTLGAWIVFKRRWRMVHSNTIFLRNIFFIFFRLNYIFLFPVILSNRSFLVFLQLFPIPNQA